MGAGSLKNLAIQTERKLQKGDAAAEKKGTEVSKTEKKRRSENKRLG